MTQVHIEIKNIAEIRRAFDQAPRLMNSEFKDALQRSAIQVQRESMIRTPVLTGRLRASHTFDVSGSGLQMKAEVGPTVNYGMFVHEGTRFMKGRPFLKEGADASLNEIDDYFTKATQNVFDKIGRMV
jgi:HK97 gp10 family phage protein